MAGVEVLVLVDDALLVAERLSREHTTRGKPEIRRAERNHEHNREDHAEVDPLDDERHMAVVRLGATRRPPRCTPWRAPGPRRR